MSFPRASGGPEDLPTPWPRNLTSTLRIVPGVSSPQSVPPWATQDTRCHPGTGTAQPGRREASQPLPNTPWAGGAPAPSG